MPTRRRYKDDDEGEEPPYDGGEGTPTLGNPDADPVRIHRQYVEQRLAGGAPPTPEAYARAIEQWHRLPGAVSAPVTEVTVEEPAPSPQEYESTDVEDVPPDEQPA